LGEVGFAQNPSLLLVELPATCQINHHHENEEKEVDCSTRYGLKLLARFCFIVDGSFCRFDRSQQ